MTGDRRSYDQRVTVEVPAWVAALREPFGRSILLFVLLGVAAVLGLVLGWRGAARTPDAWLQVPWLVSGGLGGLGLLGLAVGAWSIHLSRRQDAEGLLELRWFAHDVHELCDDIQRRRPPPSSSAP